MRSVQSERFEARHGWPRTQNGIWLPGRVAGFTHVHSLREDIDEADSIAMAIPEPFLFPFPILCALIFLDSFHIYTSVSQHIYGFKILTLSMTSMNANTECDMIVK